MEAIMSRPLPLAAVVKDASRAGQTTLIQGKTNYLKSLVANMGKALQLGRVAADQFKGTDPWATLLRYVSNRIAPAIGPFSPLAGPLASE